MERDCMIAHGAAQFLKERLMDVSDKYNVSICKKCGVIASENIEKGILKCMKCGINSDIVNTNIPYAFKLLVQELMSMGVTPRLAVK
jgi:DNA-directed RNA polymerase II subunit RPB2